MIKIMVGEIPGKKAVRARQQPANPARTLQTARQVVAPRVAHLRRIVDVPLLDHPVPVVDVIDGAAYRPASAGIRPNSTGS